MQQVIAYLCKLIKGRRHIGSFSWSRPGYSRLTLRTLYRILHF